MSEPSQTPSSKSKPVVIVRRSNQTEKKRSISEASESNANGGEEGNASNSNDSHKKHAGLLSGASAPPAGKSGQKLLREYRSLVGEIARDSMIGIGARPIGEDLMKWEAVIEGPSDSPFANAWFLLRMSFTNEYPHAAPDVVFAHPMYHPNIYASNRICLDILADKWSPVYQISTVLLSIRSLLTDPNPDSPANPDAARDYRKDRQIYAQNVLKCIVEQKRNTLELPDWYIEMKQKPE